ncbi:MAG: hypothetical protein JXK95_10925 [Bacteroidales bacterium]|nr:hypothetical protein [Bacteroidales bacterium]
MKNINNRFLTLLIIGLMAVSGSNTLAQQEKGKDDKVKGKPRKEMKETGNKVQPKGPQAHKQDTGRFHSDKPEEEKGKAEMKERPHGERGQDDRRETGKDGPQQRMKRDSLRPEMSKGQREHEMEKEKEKEGHAYGKNKGDLKGREYGQSRAEQARMEQHKKETELEHSVSEGEAKVKEGREKVRVAREKLEKDKKEQKLSETEYKEKKEKIDKAEKALDDLEMKVKKGKGLEKK